MTVGDMDICLNISSGSVADASKKVKRNKDAFFKPHVKRLQKKSISKVDENKNTATEKNQLKSLKAEPKGGVFKTRVKQKSLATIVANNLARSKSVAIQSSDNAVNNNGDKSSSQSSTAAASVGEQRVQTQQKQEIKELVSFVKPSKENAITTILAKTRTVNDGKTKKSLSDIFAKNSDSRDTETKLLRAESKADGEDKVELKQQKNGKQFANSTKFESADDRQAQFSERDNGANSKKFKKSGLSKSEDKRDKSNYKKPSGKVSSLFGNNPEVPNIGQRLVKPVNETVFSKTSFSDLGIHDYMVSNLEQNMKITNMTTVQQKAIPVILSGRNVLIRSQTGSGKTLAYALPIVETLHKIRPKLKRDSGLKALIVVPTRELVLQTYECFLKLVRSFTWIVPGYLVGGEKRKAEKARLRKGCTILVATPGRLLDHIKHTEALKLNDVKCFVLDEADRMLDMGYEKDISGIVQALEKSERDAKCSYDPLQLIRDNNSKKTENHEEIEPQEDKKTLEEAEDQSGDTADNGNDDGDLDNSDEDENLLEKREYHSGTDSDSDDQEFPIRSSTKKSKETPNPSKKLKSKASSKEIDQDEEIKISSKIQEKENSEISSNSSSRQTILLSATLTAAVEKLAGLTMKNPAFVDAAQENLSTVGGNLSETNEDLVVPQGVVQSYIVTPPKLRMVTLSAYIAGKCQTAGEHKILVFMATQDMVDYHVDILSTILGKPRDDEDEDSDPLVDVDFFKLHGSMSQKERTDVFKTFRKARSGVLLCTDVAARGLDMPKVDTVIQYTGPLSARDYVHRIGRTARAGTTGTSTIFLTPPEVDFVRMLESRRIRIKQEDMNDVLDKLMDPLSKHRSVQVAATSLQNQFENLVLENKKFHSKACKAYVSWIRFYASYPRDMREIFNRKELHLGHYAKSFALRDPPQKIGGIGKTIREAEPSTTEHNNRLSNERPTSQPQKRPNGATNGHKPGMLKRSRMLNTSEYGSGLEFSKKSKKF